MRQKMSKNSYQETVHSTVSTMVETKGGNLNKQK